MPNDDDAINPEQRPVEVVIPPKRRVPAIFDHFNERDLKIVFRCWVGAWVGSLLMLIPASLQSLGTATFFATMVQLMIPPSGIVFIYLLGGLSLMAGLFLAWAWGVIVMKAALAARPAAATQAQLQSLQQAALAQANQTGIAPAAAAQRLIFDGYMLDARVTAVTYCLMCLFIYLLARVRANNPKFALTQIFGTIIADIFICFTPSLPSFSGTLPLSFVKPAAVGIGLGFACSILFFPRSTSHVVLDSIEDILALLKTPLELTSSTLAKDAGRLDLKELRGIRAKIIAAYKQMEPALAFLPLDFSVGCWDSQDVQSLQGPVRDIMVATLSLLEFQINRVYQEARREVILERHYEAKQSRLTEKNPAHVVGHHQISRLVEFLEGLSASDAHPVPDLVAQDLLAASQETISVCVEGLAVARDCIHMVNTGRVFRPSQGAREELVQRSKIALERVRGTRASFVLDATDSLLRRYAPVLEQVERSNQLTGSSQQLREFVLCMVFEEQLSSVIDKTEALLDHVATRFEKSPRTRIWVPSSLRYAASWVAGKKGDVPAMASQNDPDPDETEDATKAAQEKLQLSRKYRVRKRSGLGRAIIGTYHWFTSNEGLYALRVVIVTIALSIPGAIPSSAGFFYREKGLWALIMGQTGLLVYMADFVFSALARIIGTIVGGVLGLLAWYIGSGTGPGNPYGLAAVMAVMLVFFVWIRLFLPPSLLQPGIMAGATFLLTVGYSYDDTHIPQYGNPGVGYNIFWRRLLLVLIGVAAALIIQVFPSPPSAARHICKTLSNSIRALSDHYALMLSCWGKPGDTGLILAEPITLKLAESLVTLDGSIQLLRFEFSSSRFDSSSLEEVKRFCHTINRELGRLLYLSASLPLEFQDRLAQQMGLLDDRNIGEIMAVLTVCEQALKTGDPPPEVLPTPLARRALDYWQVNQVPVILSADLVRDPNYRRFCVALNSYIKFLTAVDGMVLVIKEALGEAHLISRDFVDPV